jgi:ABC-2 type transport system ATP-binding protein
MLAIEARDLEKTYQRGGDAVHAVAGVNLSIEQGEIYALLGPNGAGKTTTINMLTTLLLPTAGTARVAGFDVATDAANVRRKIGVTFQEMVLDQELTGRQVLDFHAQLYGLSRNKRKAAIAELAALVELTEVLDRNTARYSGGMKRRLELARGLMTEPQVLFLDEPTQGLDPQNRASIWKYVRKLRKEKGITLLLTTHSMDEAEALADRVGIIDHGKLVVEGVPAQLARALGADVITVTGSGDSAALARQLSALSFVQHVHCRTMEPPTTEQAPESSVSAATGAIDQILQIGVDHGDRRLAEVVALAGGAFHIHEISVARPSLADVFLAYTGHRLRDEPVG